MTSSDFVSVDQILAEVVTYTADENFKKGYSKGRYYSWIERGLTDLSYNTFYEQKTCDIKIDVKRLAIDIPEGLFNVREVYAFTPDKNGKFCNSVIVHNKRLYNNRGKGESYTAKVRIAGNTESQNLDPYYNDYTTTGYENIYFYNINGRLMMLSSNLVHDTLNPIGDHNLSTKFTHIRIVANATGVEKIGDAPIILRILKEAVISWTVEQFFAAEKAKNRSMAQDWKEWNAIRSSRFMEAEERINRMDTAAKEDLFNYMASLGIDNQW